MASVVGRARRNADQAKYEAEKMDRISKSPQGVNLYVKNLHESVTDDMLRAEFETVAGGTVTSAQVMKDMKKRGGKKTSRGFGFVCYSAPEEAARAIDELNGKMIGGKRIFVALAQPKEEAGATSGPANAAAAAATDPSPAAVAVAAPPGFESTAAGSADRGPIVAPGEDDEAGAAVAAPAKSSAPAAAALAVAPPPGFERTIPPKPADIVPADAATASSCSDMTTPHAAVVSAPPGFEQQQRTVVTSGPTADQLAPPPGFALPGGPASATGLYDGVVEDAFAPFGTKLEPGFGGVDGVLRARGDNVDGGNKGDPGGGGGGGVGGGGVGVGAEELSAAIAEDDGLGGRPMQLEDERALQEAEDIAMEMTKGMLSFIDEDEDDHDDGNDVRDEDVTDDVVSGGNGPIDRSIKNDEAPALVAEEAHGLEEQTKPPSASAVDSQRVGMLILALIGMVLAVGAAALLHRVTMNT